MRRTLIFSHRHRRNLSSLLFDRNLKARQKLWSLNQGEHLDAASGFRNEIDSTLYERDLKETPAKILLLGKYGNTLLPKLVDELGCTSVKQTDISGHSSAGIELDEEVWDEELSGYQMIIGNMNLHWINMLDDTCQNIRRSLSKDGCFLGCILGGESVFELRSSLIVAQQKILGGISPNVSPLMKMNDVASLLVNSQFHDITVDSTEFRIMYPNVAFAMRDLQLLGESNALRDRKPYLRKDVLQLAEKSYLEMYGDANGNIPMTLQATPRPDLVGVSPTRLAVINTSQDVGRCAIKQPNFSHSLGIGLKGCTMTAESQSSTSANETIIMLEQSHLKVPWEQIRRSFRYELKIAEKDLVPVIGALKVLRLSDTDKLSKARGKLLYFLEKLTNSRINTLKFSEKLEKRIFETEAIIEKLEDGLSSSTSFELSRWYKSRMTRIIIECLLRNGYARSAKLLLESSDPDFADSEVYDERDRIRDAILGKSAAECLAWCSDNRAALKKRSSSLEFLLRRQEFIELARQRELSNAIMYARKHFPSFADTNGLDIEQALALLAVRPETSMMPYSWLYNDERWLDIANQFETESQDLHGLCDRPQLSSLIRVGLSALKTPLCGGLSSFEQVDCPVCSPPLSKLAASIPFAHHETSSLVCYISGEAMDADNPPMVLPNGFVYSRRSLESMAAKMDGHVKCPRSQSCFQFSEVRKCFIS